MHEAGVAGVDPNETSFEAMAYLPVHWAMSAPRLQFLTDLIEVIPRDPGCTAPLWGICAAIPHDKHIIPYGQSDPA